MKKAVDYLKNWKNLVTCLAILGSGCTAERPDVKDVLGHDSPANVRYELESYDNARVYRFTSKEPHQESLVHIIDTAPPVGISNGDRLTYKNTQKVRGRDRVRYATGTWQDGSAELDILNYGQALEDPQGVAKRTVADIDYIIKSTNEGASSIKMYGSSLPMIDRPIYEGSDKAFEYDLTSAKYSQK